MIISENPQFGEAVACRNIETLQKLLAACGYEMSLEDIMAAGEVYECSVVHTFVDGESIVSDGTKFWQIGGFGEDGAANVHHITIPADEPDGGYYMNPATGSVDTWKGWLKDWADSLGTVGEWPFDELHNLVDELHNLVPVVENQKGTPGYNPDYGEWRPEDD